MTDPNDQGPPIDDVPIEEQPMAVESPRREASARFEIEGEVGSAAALREAMDPANQSLADALRLSFRVLQLVIVVLIVLFLVSGFQRVQEQQSGVMLRFGDIVTVDGEQALEPGLHRNVLPYPAGEFVIFDVDNRAVVLDEAYFPRLPQGRTVQEVIERANIKSSLDPGNVGYVLTGDNDIAHLRITADFQVTDPVALVNAIDPAAIEQVVRHALQRAAVRAAADLTLQEIVDEPEVAAEQIRDTAQRTVDDLGCGIEFTSVTLPEHMPPFAIVRTYGELQNAREEARRQIEQARQRAEEVLIDAAGPRYVELVERVRAFEDAASLGDEAAAEALLARINAFMESDVARGEVARIIQRAGAYESEIELTLGQEYRRFRDLLPAHREQPGLTWKRRWLEAYREVLGRPGVEVFHVPVGLGSMKITISGSEDVQKKRRSEELRRKQQAAQLEAVGIFQQHQQRADEWTIGESNPMLEVRDGKIVPRGREE